MTDRLSIDPSRLSQAQLARLVQHLDSHLDAIVEANRTLTLKLAETSEELTDRQRAILNEWSAFLNNVSEASAAEIAKIVSARGDEALN